MHPLAISQKGRRAKAVLQRVLASARFTFHAARACGLAPRLPGPNELRLARPAFRCPSVGHSDPPIVDLTYSRFPPRAGALVPPAARCSPAADLQCSAA